MTLKQRLEEIWKRTGSPVNPLHINLWSPVQRGYFLGTYDNLHKDDGKVYVSKGRLVKARR